MLFLERSDKGNIMARIVRGETQEVFDTLITHSLIPNQLWDLRNVEVFVKANNEEDARQMYIKGLVDGMRSYYLIVEELLSYYKKNEEQE